jgi:hypothetical protein
MSRAQLTSTTQQDSGGAVAPVSGGKNFLVNGGMDFNQRGSAAVSAVNAYCLDRWYVSGFGSGANNSFGQIGTVDGPANFKNYLRYGQGTGTANTNFFLSQSLETLNVIPLQGKAVTFSFWYRTATPFTSTWQAQIVTSTSTDQNINNLYIGASVTAASVVIPNSTSWRYAQITGTISSTATSLAVGFVTTGNVVANATFDVTGLQLEVGSVATPFARAGGTLQGELALCQRYYQTVSAFTGIGAGTTYVISQIQFPVKMRTSPSVAASGAITITDTVASDYTQSSSNATITNSNRVSSDGISVTNGNFTGLTTYRPYECYPTSSSSVLQFSAEL